MLSGAFSSLACLQEIDVACSNRRVYAALRKRLIQALL